MLRRFGEVVIDLDMIRGTGVAKNDMGNITVVMKDLGFIEFTPDEYDALKAYVDELTERDQTLFEERNARWYLQPGNTNVAFGVSGGSWPVVDGSNA